MELKLEIEDMKRSRTSKGDKHTPYIYVPREWRNREVIIILLPLSKK